ncbi:MAG: nascent polypeptide-associated complex protein [Nitrososphaeraceae archaeon]|jgi:nascent polypeptide-associated complex subunit alpha
MMRGGNREMRRMLDKMGLEMKDLGSIEEVVIKTETKELYLIKPQVIEMKGKDSTIFQVVATNIEEKQRDIPVFKEEDVILVMQQATVSKEKAIQALIDSKGDMAQAILNLTT